MGMSDEVSPHLTCFMKTSDGTVDMVVPVPQSQKGHKGTPLLTERRRVRKLFGLKPVDDRKIDSAIGRCRHDRVNTLCWSLCVD
jgi:hypothetical protein